VRGRPGNRLTVAVGGDARLETAINALLDLLAWQWQMTVERRKPADAADLLVGDGPNASQILDVMTLVATRWPATHLPASRREFRHDAAEPGSRRTGSRVRLEQPSCHLGGLSQQLVDAGPQPGGDRPP
jgi:hypothetical protein